MVSFYCKFTENFDVILVNYDDVYLDYRVFVVSQYLEELLSKIGLYYVYATKQCKAKIIQSSTTSRDRCNVYLNEDAA